MQTANAINPTVNPAKNIAAQHNRVEKSRIIVRELTILVKNGTHNCIIMPIAAKPVYSSPMFFGDNFKISTVND